MTEPILGGPSDARGARPVDLGRDRNATSSLLFHTLRHLPPRQIAALLVRRIRGATENTGSFFRGAVPPTPGCRWEPRREFIAPSSHYSNAEDLLRGNFSFIEQTEPLGWPPSWNARGVGRLWEYNLHYFEYLWALDFDSAKAVVGDWIANHDFWWWRHVVTGDDGTFTIDNVLAGTYRAAAFRQGYHPSEPVTVMVEDGQTTVVDFVLDPLAFGALEGQVTDASTGEPIADAAVFAHPLTLGGFVSLTHLRFTHTNADGFYHFEHLAAGGWRILVHASGYQPALAEAKVLEGETTVLNLALDPL